MQVTKENRKKELFNEIKLTNSLIGAGAKKEVAEAITREVKGQIFDGITTKEIYDKALEIAHSAEKRIAARYSLRRAIADLGPTGFPFEKFVAEIFKAKGYETLTDQIMHGACTEHEVDVVAYNEKELIVAEVKFHNEIGIKSDLKVALYVKARHDDLKEVKHNVAGKERSYTDGWLVTNTKFTQSAVEYAMCENLKLVGWNYPVRDNLENLITQNFLYPITCLVSLNTNQKQQLISKEIILVKQIKNDQSTLQELNMSTDEIQKVIDEITILFFN
jgi:hypothetical protein